MECPDCGATLVTYRLAEREAPVCEQCGHVGIDAEHRAARLRVESWGDALRRFYGTDDEFSVAVDATASGGSSERSRPETWAAALERFYRASAPNERSDDGAAGDGDADD
jgi:hypothetical protein